jgi:DNA-binding transcriptional ArsR family regulator
VNKNHPKSEKILALIARRFRLLGEPFRLRLLQELEDGELTVGELVFKLDGNQSNVSKHLQMLHQAGFVSRRREGNSVYYGIADTFVMKLCDLVCKNTVQHAEDDLHDLRRYSKD